jgi:hypothetical protein
MKRSGVDKKKSTISEKFVILAETQSFVSPVFFLLSFILSRWSKQNYNLWSLRTK